MAFTRSNIANWKEGGTRATTNNKLKENTVVSNGVISFKSQLLFHFCHDDCFYAKTYTWFCTGFSHIQARHVCHADDFNRFCQTKQKKNYEKRKKREEDEKRLRVKTVILMLLRWDCSHFVDRKKTFNL